MAEGYGFDNDFSIGVFPSKVSSDIEGFNAQAEKFKTSIEGLREILVNLQNTVNSQGPEGIQTKSNVKDLLDGLLKAGGPIEKLEDCKTRVIDLKEKVLTPIAAAIGDAQGKLATNINNAINPTQN